MNETSITRTTIDEAKKTEDLTDLKRVNSMDESEIEANALCDPKDYYPKYIFKLYRF